MCEFLTISILFLQITLNVAKMTFPDVERFQPGNKNDYVDVGKDFLRLNQGFYKKYYQEEDLTKDKFTKFHNSHTQLRNWPLNQHLYGAVSAVALDTNRNVVIFQRSDRVWNSGTFNNENVFMNRNMGPISQNTVIAFDRKNGRVVYEWGQNLFYMPHGLTIDNENNTWLTDVALHQVFKFIPKSYNASLVLGKAFEPGHTRDLFCKPTSVAVLKNGDFFVADGYCNSRIKKFSSTGELLLVWGHNSYNAGVVHHPPMNYFNVPHALSLVPELNLICVADRENGRIQCFFANNGTSHSQYYSEVIGSKIYSIAYAPVNGGQLYILNGPTESKDASIKNCGFIINIKKKTIVSKFVPNDEHFNSAHDIAVTENGDEIYVAEINPNRVHKFISKTLFENENTTKVNE